jgi:plastocyanin
MDKRLLIILIVVALGAGITVLLLIMTRPASRLTPTTQPTDFNQEIIQEESIPTLSPEEIEIISKLETHVVTLENDSFSPQNLTIKHHDQVEWQNKDQETYQIKGEEWGDVPIEPGESFTQAFDQVGVYSYSCPLHPDLTGTIVVE